MGCLDGNSHVNHVKSVITFGTAPGQTHGLLSHTYSFNFYPQMLKNYHQWKLDK